MTAALFGLLAQTILVTLSFRPVYNDNDSLHMVRNGQAERYCKSTWNINRNG